MDGRNPFRTTLTPWETSICWYLELNPHNHGFIGGAEFRPSTVGEVYFQRSPKGQNGRVICSLREKVKHVSSGCLLCEGTPCGFKGNQKENPLMLVPNPAAKRTSQNGHRIRELLPSLWTSPRKLQAATIRGPRRQRAQKGPQRSERDP